VVLVGAVDDRRNGHGHGHRRLAVGGDLQLGGHRVAPVGDDSEIEMRQSHGARHRVFDEAAGLRAVARAPERRGVTVDGRHRVRCSRAGEAIGTARRHPALVGRGVAQRVIEERVRRVGRQPRFTGEGERARRGQGERARQAGLRVGAIGLGGVRSLSRHEDHDAMRWIEG
jgi:hypothetical protein